MIQQKYKHHSTFFRVSTITHCAGIKFASRCNLVLGSIHVFIDQLPTQAELTTSGCNPTYICTVTNFRMNHQETFFFEGSLRKGSNINRKRLAAGVTAALPPMQMDNVVPIRATNTSLLGSWNCCFLFRLQDVTSMYCFLFQTETGLGCYRYMLLSALTLNDTQNSTGLSGLIFFDETNLII